MPLIDRLIYQERVRGGARIAMSRGRRTPAGPWHRSKSGAGECLFDVRDDVVDVLDAH